MSQRALRADEKRTLALLGLPTAALASLWPTRALAREVDED